MADSTALEIRELISLSLNKHFIVKGNYGSKANSVTLIILKKSKRIHLHPALVLRDKIERKKKKVLKHTSNMLSPSEKWED